MTVNRTDGPHLSGGRMQNLRCKSPSQVSHTLLFPCVEPAMVGKISSMSMKSHPNGDPKTVKFSVGEGRVRGKEKMFTVLDVQLYHPLYRNAYS